MEPELLAEDAIPAGDPFGLFGEWLTEAKASEINDPTAMALATASAGGARAGRRAGRAVAAAAAASQ